VKAFFQWAACVVTATAAGLLVGWTVGASLRGINADYIPDVAHYVGRGSRIGLFAGTVVAAAAFMGRREGALLRTVAARAVAASFAVGVFAFLAGIAAYRLSRAGIIHLAAAEQGQIGNPNRLMVCLAIERSTILGSAVATMTLALWTWRSRVPR
jgi:hypothetical protein